MVRLVVLIPEDLKEATRIKAKNEDITMSQVVRLLLRIWVKLDAAFLRRLLDEALEAYPTREEFAEKWRQFKELKEGCEKEGE